ncbi:MAG: hypothetical protein U0S36_04470 [Candidatus Nanopelagicales bacterium]
MARAEQSAHYLDEVRMQWGEGPLAQGPTGLAVRTGTTQVRNDIAADPAYEPWLRPPARTASRAPWCCPCTSAARSTGCSGCTPPSRAPSTTSRSRCSRTSRPTSGSGSPGCARSARLREAVARQEQSASRMRATLDSLLDPFALLESVPATRTAARRPALRRRQRLRSVLQPDAARPSCSGPRAGLFPALLDSGPLAAYSRRSRPAKPMILDDVPYVNEMFGTTRYYDLRGQDRRRAR